MSKRRSQLARSSLINACFDRVAKIEGVKNEYIALKVWLHLIREYNKGNEEVTNLTASQVKTTITKSNRFPGNSNNVSPTGYYYRTRSGGTKRKADGTTETQTSIQAVLVTDVGQLPPLSNTPWWEAVIIPTDPSWLPVF